MNARKLVVLCLGLGLLGGPAWSASVEIADSRVTPGGTIEIQVESSSSYYYVLYVQPNLQDGSEVPVSMALGEDGTTLLSESLAACPLEHYRVESFAIDHPGDLDGDGLDDVEEFLDQGYLSPFNPADPIDIRNGAVEIPDRETYQVLSYQGTEGLRATYLYDVEFVKFFILDANTETPSVYFMNTNTHRAHMQFANAVGISRMSGMRSPGSMGTNVSQLRGEIVYHPHVTSPTGTLGVYQFEFEPNDSFSFEIVQMAYELLAANMPVLENNLFYYPMPNAALPRYYQEQDLYDDSRVAVLLEDDICADIAFASLHLAEGFGLLQEMGLEDQPNWRDIVIYEALPNEMPRVGGIITTVPQTPLSHVNLRAIQDEVPNAYIADAAEDEWIQSLVGKYVYYRVDESGYEIREATLAEVEAYYADLQPDEAQTPERDLTITDITDLDDIAFEEWTSFGVKAANVATLRTFDFEEGTVPDGYAVPFYFYDEFMKYNGFYDHLEAMLADPDFLNDYDVQVAMLAEFREMIEDGDMPEWMGDALTDLQESFPEGTSIRCRSSTNNEDLPGFSGAGLYDSKTQHPDEGHISKSIQQVYASLWNFRAFDEREFYRIDHFETAMGVLVHPNYSDELANGVGVTTDPIYGSEDTYYLNTQLGEDLVTNPDALSIPEEILLGAEAGYTIVRQSNLIPDDDRLLTDEDLDQLRAYMTSIDEEFRRLYDIAEGEPFAMEIEYKITRDGDLAIKQARPWIFSSWE